MTKVLSMMITLMVAGLVASVVLNDSQAALPETSYAMLSAEQPASAVVPQSRVSSPQD